MNNQTLFCCDPYAQNAEEYFGIDCTNLITPVENLTEKIESEIQKFVIKYSQRNKN